MLDRRRRINTDRDHHQVWRSGRVVRNKSVVLRYRPSTASRTRYGFVVSTTVAKRATVRNLIKRRLRAIAQDTNITPPLDIVVYATKAAALATYNDLKKDFTTALQQTVYAQTPHRRY